MLIVRHREVLALSLAHARVLLADGVAWSLLGVDLGDLQAEGDIPLPEALDGHGGTAAEWRRRLAGLCVPLLDVNTAPMEALARVPDVGPDEAQVLIEARPYLNLEELAQAGADLASISARLAPYVGHDGYLFFDKPAGRPIAFDVDLAEGLLVRRAPEANPFALQDALSGATLRSAFTDDEERLHRCHWDPGVLPVERPVHLRRLKESDPVSSVAPVLRDRQGELRVPYPDRLDVMLVDGANDLAWRDLATAYELTMVEQYMPHYRSLRVAADPHDLGALYRTLRALVDEASVRFVEPTYLV